MEITLTIKQSEVYAEVAQTTDYTGAKMTEDEGAYGRIPTQDDDESQLERFWNEARSGMCGELKGVLSEEGLAGDSYAATLNVSAAFDTALQASMQDSMFSYFVQSIMARWFTLANKAEAEAAAAKAAALLEDIKQKAYYKKKPKRPTYT